MSVFVFGSLHGAPGVTTTAMLVTACLGRGVLVEADGDGGVLALQHGLPRDPGLSTLATTRAASVGWESHVQRVAGVPVLVGPESPERTSRLWAQIGERLMAMLASSFDGTEPDVVVDAGRVRPGWPPVSIWAAASRLVVFARPTAEDLAALVQRLPRWDVPVGVVLCGSGAYRRSDVVDQLGVEVLGQMPSDQRAAAVVRDGGSGRVLAGSGLARAARSLADRLTGAEVGGVNAVDGRLADRVRSHERRFDPTLIARLHRRVGDKLSDQAAAREAAGEAPLGHDHERALAHRLLADELAAEANAALRDGRELLTPAQEAAITAEVLDRLHGLARLQPLIDNPAIRDIHISGHDRVWLSMRTGGKQRGDPVADSDAELIELIATAARRLGRSERRWDYAHPELNLQLPNGDRLHALMAVSGRPTITIRRHDFELHRLDHLVERGVFDELLAGFLAAAVRARLNVIVAGGTNTGKTTLLRCLINEIDADERLITIEDSLEIGLDRFEHLHPDYETLEAREANVEGVGEFSLADLVRAGLRMDPDRVIVGEVRGAEVLPMLLAMSQGNDGSMCSIHADSSKGVFSRLAMYAAMTRERLEPAVTNLLAANAVDLVVHIGWVAGARRVTSVREVTGLTDTGDQVASNELWRPDTTGAAQPAAPASESTAAALGAVGFDWSRVHTAGGFWR